jgi:ribosomal protein L37E
VTTALATSPLTAADRCDRCGARAYVRVLLTSGGELLFCAHHGREHAPRLREVAADIQDESSRLEGTPAIAADDER